MPRALACVGVVLWACGAAATAVAGTWSIAKGAQYDLCNALLRGLKERNIQYSFLCDVPIATDDPDFRRPNWTDADPMEHVDLIRESLFFTLTDFRRLQYRFDEEQRGTIWIASDEQVREAIDEVFVEHNDRLLEILRDPNFVFRSAPLDINHDGATETIYSMNTIFTRPINDQRDSRELRIIDCPPESGGGPLLSRIYLDTKEYPSLARGMRIEGGSWQPFLYRGRVYLRTGNAIYEPQSSKPTVPLMINHVVCDFRYSES